MISLMLHEVRVRRRTIIGWALGLGFFAVMYMSFYPALPEEMRNLDIGSVEIYQSLGVESMATFEGYLDSTVINFLPLLVGAFGIVLGAGALAGEEDAGTLEHLAALPISRLQLYVAKAVAVIVAAVLSLLAVGAVAAAVFLALESEIDTSVTAADVFWVLLGHSLIAFVFVSLGLFLGAFLPTRGSALAAASAILVVTFFGNNLAGMVTELESVQPIFPFSYFRRYADMLTGDVPWDDVLVLIAMGAVLLVLGAIAFGARNLTVAAWPWQRPQPAGTSARRMRPQVVTGLVSALGVMAIVVAALALLDDGELRFWESDNEATEVSATAPTSAPERDEGAAADDEAPSAASSEAEGTATIMAVATPLPGAQTPGEAPRPTATLRILP